MLEKKYRLKKNKEFNYVYKKGESVFSKNLGLFYVRTKLSPFKVGISISNKVGNSVVRHKLKRRICHIIRPILKDFNPHYNYVFLARPGIEEFDFDELKASVEKAISKIPKGVPTPKTTPKAN